jgi:hypothetical protein
MKIKMHFMKIEELRVEFGGCQRVSAPSFRGLDFHFLCRPFYIPMNFSNLHHPSPRTLVEAFHHKEQAAFDSVLWYNSQRFRHSILKVPTAS